MNRDKSVIKVMLKYGTILSIIGVLLSTVIIFLLREEFDKDQKNELSSITSLTKNAIKATDESADIYEKLVDLRMLVISRAISKQLAGRKAETISKAELSSLRDEWGLSELSIFVQKEGDIVVTKSTDDKEIGLSSKSWGYWFTAFEQLFRLENVQVNQGYAAQYFWAGPLSKSVVSTKQYLYAYYYDGNTDFMINPYISAEDVQVFIDSYGPNKLINSILQGSKDIEEIAVLNVDAYLMRNTIQIVEPKKDTPIVYGTYHFSSPEDTQVLSRKLPLEGSSISIREKGKEYKKLYLPLSDNRVLVVVMNVTELNKVIYRFLGIIVSIFLAAFIIIFTFVKKMNRETVTLHEKIRKLAYFDSLTGLPNRNHFQEHVNAIITDSRNRFALFIIDLDNFKFVNDTLGHAAGDRFLVEVSKRINSQLDGRGFFSRMGGDEFTLILPVTNMRDAEDVAKQLLLCTNENFLMDKMPPLKISFSMGISMYPDNGRELDSLLKQADMALYDEKNNGKNNYGFATIQNDVVESALHDNPSGR